MHSLFPDWYYEIHGDPSPELLKRRWDAVEQLASALTLDILPELVETLLGAGEPGSDFKPTAVSEFKKADASFPGEPGPELMRVMLAGCAAHIVGTKEQRSVVLSLALRSADCRGVGIRCKPTKILEEAHEFLHAEGARIRSRSTGDIPKPRFRNAKWSYPAPKPVEVSNVGGNQWNVVTANDKALAAGVKELADTVTELSQVVSELREDTRQAFAKTHATSLVGVVPVLKEELEILWWLFSERSSDLGDRIAELDHRLAPLVAAKELADRTAFSPMPPSSDAFLGRAIRDHKDVEVTLQSAIDQAPADWLHLLPLKSALGRLTPVLSAAGKADAARGARWAASFEEAVGFSADAALPLSEWASQLLDELLLARMLDAEAEG